MGLSRLALEEVMAFQPLSIKLQALADIRQKSCFSKNLFAPALKFLNCAFPSRLMDGSVRFHDDPHSEKDE